MKTPRGVHLRPEIKERIRELYAGGTTSGAEIAGQIPGLTSSQARSALQNLRDPSYKARNSTRRARQMTGNPEATRADYEREMAARRARQMTGNPEATSADYEREMAAQRARQMTGNPEATSADYDREIRARRARQITGNPNATAADYDREIRAARARQMTGNPEATAADYDREIKAARARQMTGNPEATAADYQREMRARKKTVQQQGEASGSGRPVVALSSMAEAGSRSWNAGDRFSIPGPDGNPQDVEVTRNRHGGEEVYRGDFRLLLRGG